MRVVERVGRDSRLGKFDTKTRLRVSVHPLEKRSAGSRHLSESMAIRHDSGAK
jgi:hypothetical protein